MLALLSVVVLSGCQTPAQQGPIRSDCEPINFVPDPDGAMLPVGYVENGLYLFVEGKPRSKACIRARVCEVNDWVREHANQSYYIKLDSVGGREIARQFPEIVEDIREGSDLMGWHLYLNNFCRATE